MNVHAMSKIDSRGPNPTDVEVGRRMRLRRKQLGLSQEKLGAKVGVTFQQIQKYEKGTNRVGASRLLQVAEALDAPIAYFFPRSDDRPMPAAFDIAEAIAGIRNTLRNMDQQLIKIERSAG